MIMKRYKWIASLIIFLVAFTQWTAAQNNQHNRNVYVSANEWGSKDFQEIAKGTNLTEVLSRIEREHNVNFLFDSKLLANQQISEYKVLYLNRDLFDLLDDLLSDFGFTYKMLTHRTLGIIPEEEVFKKPVYLEVITGTVTDAQTGEALPGVNVILKGTTTGTSTGSEGDFKLDVPSLQDTLMFSFVGYQPQEVPINGRTTLNISLTPQAISGDEVVVTAFGLERETRSLTYSTQSVDTEQITEARELNVATSLQGKVAGMSVTQGNTGLGADTRIVLRGNRSISGSSEPLFVLDGVPIRGSISDLNPDDIENIDVLKGPNAAALYGSAAQNGAIIVTTKKGQKNSVQVSLSNTFQVLDPMLLIDYQNQYGQGSGGNYDRTQDGSWGPRMEGQQVAHWTPDPSRADETYDFEPQPDNINDIMQLGYNNASNISANIGGERTQSVFSYTYTDARGILPEQALNRHNVSLRVTSQLTDQLELDGRLSYINTRIDNENPQGETLENPWRQIYRVPRNYRTEDMRQYEWTDALGNVRHNYMNVGASGTGMNPYWNIYNIRSERTRERILAMTSLTYNFTDNISLMVRGAYDGGGNFQKRELHTNSYGSILAGRYHENRNDAYELNTDFLLSYTESLTENWDISANLGGNYKQQRNKSLNAHTGNQGLIIPNLFTLSNTGQVDLTQSIGNPIDVASLYAFGDISWKDAIFLDLTGRNDWSSTLPRGNRSYFYPSAGLSVVLTDLIEDFPDLFSFARLRGSWSKVGSGANAFQLNRYLNFSAGGQQGFLQLQTTLPNENLVPEETVGIEVGADFRFLDGRLGLDATLYKTNTRNQLFTIALPVGSGANEFFTNGGDVENKGIEFVLRTRPVESPDFTWEVDANFSLNRNKVLKLNDERPILTLTTDFLRAFRIVEGRPFGEVYSRGFERVDEDDFSTVGEGDSEHFGSVIVGSSGVPQTTSGQNTLVANFNPDWMGGITSTFNYKNWSLSFLIDHRQGGSITSITNAIIDADGVTKRTLNGREGGLIFGENIFPNERAVIQVGTDGDGDPIFEPNTNETDAETFWRGVGGRNVPVGEAFVEDATNTRLRELTLGYTLPQSLLANLSAISNVRVSLVGRNLFFIYKKSDRLDPDQMPGTTAAVEGFDSFAPPSTRTFGASLKIDF